MGTLHLPVPARAIPILTTRPLCNFPPSKLEGEQAASGVIHMGKSRTPQSSTRTAARSSLVR